ncbi:unnamed protein product [Caenorhabditis nigoni]
MDRTVDDEIDEPIEEEYEVDVVEPEEKSAQNPMIFFVAIVILAFFILWYFIIRQLTNSITEVDEKNVIFQNAGNGCPVEGRLKECSVHRKILTWGKEPILEWFQKKFGKLVSLKSAAEEAGFQLLILETMSNWTNEILRQDQIIYVALDCVAMVRIVEHFKIPYELKASRSRQSGRSPKSEKLPETSNANRHAPNNQIMVYIQSVYIRKYLVRVGRSSSLLLESETYTVDGDEETVEGYQNKIEEIGIKSQHLPILINFESYEYFVEESKKLGNLVELIDPELVTLLEEREEVMEKTKSWISTFAVSSSPLLSMESRFVDNRSHGSARTDLLRFVPYHVALLAQNGENGNRYAPLGDEARRQRLIEEERLRYLTFEPPRLLFHRFDNERITIGCI